MSRAIIGVLCSLLLMQAVAAHGAELVMTSSHVSAKGRHAVRLDVVSPLGRRVGEPALRNLLASLNITDVPTIEAADTSGFLQSYRRGVELTFTWSDSLKVPLHDYPDGVIVLSNIRFYGAPTSKRHKFRGRLPFGLRFGQTHDDLIAKLGPPDINNSEMRHMRWDRDRYCLFAEFSKAGELNRVALQTPVVRSNRPGFPD